MKQIPIFRESSISSGVRIICPSSAMTSQQRPHSFMPARRIRSTVASVWPFRTRTPPFLATSGNMWPGLRKSAGLAFSSRHFMAVNDRSKAEIPVVVSTWSMETVKAVLWLSVFSATIWWAFSLSAISLLMGIQISPLPYVAIKLMFSGVACSPAQMKSPSFSRSGSSVTRMIFPSFRHVSASSIVAY